MILSAPLKRKGVRRSKSRRGSVVRECCSCSISLKGVISWSVWECRIEECRRVHFHLLDIAGFTAKAIL